MEDCLVIIDSGFLSKLSKYLGGGKHLVYDIIEFFFNLYINLSYFIFLFDSSLVGGVP